MASVRLTVLGDSFAEGRGDPGPGGSYVGWVPRLAEILGIPASRCRNLGTHEATTTDVAERQLPAALAGKAPLIGVTVGVNDLVSDYDPGRFHDNLERVFTALTGAGTTVFTVSFPDIPANLPVPDGFRALLRGRFAEANDVLRLMVRRYGLLCVDVAASPAWTEPSMWAPDGLHPSPAGHAAFAEELAFLLAEDLAGPILVGS